MKILVVPAVLAAFSALTLHAAVELNGIAAKVNGQVITKKEVALLLAPTVGLLQAKYPRRGEQFEKEFKKAQNDVLEGLIENQLVLSRLEENGARIPDHIIDEEVNRIIREVFDGNEAEFRENLRKSGMTRRAFRESQRKKILVQAFRSQQFKDVAPASPGEIEKHYKERRTDLRDRAKDTITFRKIFIPAIDSQNPASTPDDQLALAELLAEELRGGDDFGEKAKEYSADAYAEEGGLQENVPRIDLDPAFGDIAFDAKPNTVVGPLKDPRGFTIVRVASVKLGPAPPLDKKMRERMRQEVEIEKRSARYKDWLTLIKRNAMVERRM